ncbi:MAG: hypothetical protein ABL932_16035 [Terricaulis sp.]
MRKIWIATALGILAACTPPAQEAHNSAAVVNNCPASATTLWSAGGGQTFSIEAHTEGPSCIEARATITIGNESGVVLTETYDAANIQALAGAGSADDMGRRLAEWITPAGASMDSVGDLEAWEAGAPEPSYAEVPFHPAPRVTREIYEALRAGNAPMYCYEESLEGGACLTVWDGVLEKIGVQSYAG